MSFVKAIFEKAKGFYESKVDDASDSNIVISGSDLEIIDGTIIVDGSSSIQGVIENSGSLRQLAFSDGSGIVSGTNDIAFDSATNTRGIIVGDKASLHFAGMLSNGGQAGYPPAGVGRADLMAFTSDGGATLASNVGSGADLIVNSSYDFDIYNNGAGGIKVNGVPISSSGGGTNFLADDGTYKAAGGSGADTDWTLTPNDTLITTSSIGVTGSGQFIGGLSTTATAGTCTLGPLSEQIWVVNASQSSSAYPNGLSYVPFVTGSEDYADFQFSSARAGSIGINFDYAMSVANGGDVELKLSFLRLSAGVSPTGSLSAQTAFTVTPGNDADIHVLSHSMDYTLRLTSSYSDYFLCRLTRTTGSNDTHTGDMRLLAIRISE